MRKESLDEAGGGVGEGSVAGKELRERGRYFRAATNYHFHY